MSTLGWITVLVCLGAGPAPERPGIFRACDSYRPNDPARPTVCLVHGMNSSSGSFVHMVPLLEAAGYGVVLYDYPFNRDLDRLAPAFADDWRGFRQRQREERPWAIVTHSMGALLARAYVEGDDYAKDVTELVMVAPPNQGSAVARAQALFQIIEAAQNAHNGPARGKVRFTEGLGAAADDLLPGSRFLRTLNRRPRRSGVRYSILAGDRGFLTAEDRRTIEARLTALTRGGGLLGGLTRLAAGDAPRQLDELTDGTGDGCVALSSARLDGVDDLVVVHADHVTLIRGPLFYPEPGPVVCMDFVLRRLARRGDPEPASR